MLLKCLLSFLNFLNFKSQGFLTYIGILLAFFAYKKSHKDWYESLKRMLIAFKAELEYSRNWFGTPYHINKYDKNHYSPRKIVFKVSFPAAVELLRRGVADKKIIDETFQNNLALFIERIEAFNQLLDYQRNLLTSNPLQISKSYTAIKRYLIDPDISLNILEQELEKLDKLKSEQLLIKQVKYINYVIHQGIIGDETREDGLYTLHKYFQEKTNDILDNFDSLLPWWLKIDWKIYILLSFALYILLTYFDVIVK